MKKILLFLIPILALSFIWQVSYGQNRIVTGNVKDAKGEPILGASVLVKGTTTGAYTDASGNFSVDIPADATTLQIKYLGMKMEEVTITASNVVNISLAPDIMGLEEVVVTALGISKEKRSLGFTTQQVKGDELTTTGEHNVIEALSSKAAGVQVIGSGGTPGASSKINIRGNSTLTGENQPLIVVDGVPIDNSTSSSVAGDYAFSEGLHGVNYSNRAIDINPEDIESVNILKGPAAAALYGKQGAPGAIIITTKRGNKGADNALHVSYGVSFETSKVNKLPKLQNIYAQGKGGGLFDSTGVTVDPNGNFIEGDPGPDELWNTDDDVSFGTNQSWGPTVASLGRTPVDNVDNFFKTGQAWTHDLSISGGTNLASARFSLSRLDDNGVVPNTDFRRTSIRVNTDAQIFKNFKMSADANYINSGGTRAQNGSNLSGVMLGLLRAPASFDLSAGYEYPKSGDNRTYFGVYDNPYWSVYNNPFTDNNNRLLGNLAGIYTPLSWLNFTGRLGLDSYTDYRKQIFAIGSNENSNAPGGEIDEDTKRYHQIYFDLIGHLDRDLNKDFNLTANAGMNVTNEYSQDEYSRGRDLTIPKFYNLSNASDFKAFEAHNTVRSAAIFGDITFGFKHYLYLNGTGRNEWSSTYGVGVAPRAFFPSADISFIFTELLPKNKILSYGKLRVAYASAGISPSVGAAYSLPSLVHPTLTDGFTDGYTTPFLGQNGFGYSQLQSLPNPLLKSERTTGREAGLELQFFGGRIGLDATYYNQLSSDLILARPIASASGFSYTYDNIGEMTNKGIELTLRADIIKSKDFKWNVTSNFSKNKSKVTKLLEDTKEILIETTFDDPNPYAIVGQPYGVLYGSKWTRTPDGSLLIGDDGLPIKDPTFGIIGDPNPDWLLNIRNTFTIKDFSIGGLLDIRHGGDIWGGTYARLNRLGRTEESANRNVSYLIPGEKLTTDGNYVPNDINVDAFNYFQHYVGDNGSAVEQHIYDGGWVRLRELSLGYNYNIKTTKYFIRAIQFNITARNLWLKTDYPGVDPETSLLGASSNANGFDYFNNPSTKSWNFRLNVQF